MQVNPRLSKPSALIWKNVLLEAIPDKNDQIHQLQYLVRFQPVW